MGSLGTMPVNERPPLGLIASAMNIHRAPGDVGCQLTFDFPLIQENTEGALLVSMVSDHDYDEELLDRFVATGQKLIDRGAVGLVSSCGFLALAQKTLTERLSVPVAATSLLQIPLIRSTIRPSEALGILTFDPTRLNDRHLDAIGVSDTSNIIISGPPPEGLMKRTLRDGIPYDLDALTVEIVDTAKALVASHPEIGAILLECTQFPPFAEAVQKATGRPVWDVYTLGEWFYSGLRRSGFPQRTKEELADAARPRERSDIELLESERAP